MINTFINVPRNIIKSLVNIYGDDTASNIARGCVGSSLPQVALLGLLYKPV